MNLLRLFTVSAALLTLASGVQGAEPALENTGLPVGERAPGFTLKDQHGEEQSLPSLLKTGPVALVFYRSADW